jgi:phosphoglycolate phosphatase
MSANTDKQNGKFAGVRALVFDLDGTLIDSKLDLALSIDATLKHMGRASLPHETIYGFVGNGAAVLVRRALGDSVTDAEAEKGHRFFLSYYREHMLDNTVTYPGVRAALGQLREHPMAVLTNKPVRFSRSIVEGLGLKHHFFQIYGGNSFEQKKPDPIGIETLLLESGLARERTIMVGDSGVDIQTARNANVQACGVSYGFQPESFVQYPPDFVVDDLAELAEYVLKRG